MFDVVFCNLNVALKELLPEKEQHLPEDKIEKIFELRDSIRQQFADGESDSEVAHQYLMSFKYINRAMSWGRRSFASSTMSSLHISNHGTSVSSCALV